MQAAGHRHARQQERHLIGQDVPISQNEMLMPIGVYGTYRSAMRARSGVRSALRMLQ